MMSTKRPDEVRPGDVIDYRGARAAVVESSATHPADGVRDPVWFVIEWTDDNDDMHRTRLAWPDVAAVERPGHEAHDADAYAAALAAQMQSADHAVTMLD